MKKSVQDFNGDPVITNCMNCQHNNDVSDGPEYGGPYFACTKEGKEYMSNLKHWPFKTPQKCFDLHYIHHINFAEIARKEQLAMEMPAKEVT